MAITVNNIGTSATGVSSLAHSITVPVGGVPAGATIVVVVSGSSGLGTITPTDGSNTYTLVQGKVYNSPVSGAAYYSPNISSLTSGSTITYTTTAAQNCGVSAIYITGLSTAPLEATITASATSSSSAPSVTSGTPAGTGDVFIGWTALQGAAQVLTRPSGWGTIPTTAAGTFMVGGGNLISTGSTAQSWNPTITGAPAYHGIFAFTAASTGVAAAYYRRRMLIGIGQ